jgi:hypothetical protein
LIARRILDDVGDCLADTWYFLQTVLRDNDLKRNAECEQAVRGARIGFGAERVAATKIRTRGAVPRRKMRRRRSFH